MLKQFLAGVRKRSSRQKINAVAKQVRALEAKSSTGTDMGVPAMGWDVLYGIIAKYADEQTEIWDAMSTRDLARAFRNYSVVFACLHMIGTTFAEAKLDIGYWTNEGGEDSWKSIPGHPALVLAENPCPEFDKNSWARVTVQRALLTGYAGSLKLRTKSGTLGRLVPVPSHRLRTRVGSLGAGDLISGYEFLQGTGEWVQMELKDVLYWFFPDPAEMCQPLAPLAAAKREYQLALERSDFLMEWLRNMKVPSLNIITEKGLSKGQRDDLREQLHDSSGRGRRGGELVISGMGSGSQVVFNNPLKDVDMPGLSAYTDTGVCAVLNVPPILVNIRAGLDRSTYSNYGEAKASFYTETMNSLWEAMACMLTLGLLRHEGDTQLEFRYHTDHLSYFQEDKNAAIERGVKVWNSGLGTRNECRVMIGLDSINEPSIGDVFKDQTNAIYRVLSPVAVDATYEETDSADATGEQLVAEDASEAG